MQHLKPSSSNNNSELETHFTATTNENPGSQPDEVARFNNSLQELKDLRSQLHHAADYCESTFLKTKQKKMVMENTKEYICRAVITVVDHLGSVSANLDRRISESNVVLESELQMDCLKQRLLTCQQYAQNLALSKVRWSDKVPRHCPHYVLKENGNLEESKGNARDIDESIASKITSKYKLGVDKEIPIFLYRNPHKPFSTTIPASNNGFKRPATESVPGLFSKILHAREAPSLPVISRNPFFHFQETNKKKHGRNEQKRRSLQKCRSLARFELGYKEPNRKS